MTEVSRESQWGSQQLANITEDGMIRVACPEWCTNTVEAHREEQDYVKLVNELCGVVHLEGRHPGPKFGAVLVTGNQNLIDGSWDFAVQTRYPVLCGPGDGLEALIVDLVAARAWIEEHR